MFGEFDPPKNKIYALIVSVPNSQFQDEIVLRCIVKFRKNSSYDRLDTESETVSDWVPPVSKVTAKLCTPLSAATNV